MIKNSNGTKTYTYTNGGMTTLTTVDENGKVISKETKPYEKTSYTREDGAVVTQESPFTSTVRYPKAPKKTTATTKDGQQYTFEGDNWINYANANGLDVGSLATALTYPSYVDAKEANRFLNEQADRYGVNLNSPIGAYESAVSKEYAAKNNLIPDYSTPFASAAAGQTNTNYDLDALKRLDQAYLDAAGAGIKIPSAVNGNGLNIGTSNSNINNIVESLGGNYPGAYQGFDYKAYFDDALKSYKDSIEAQRLASNAQFDAARATANEDYARAAQDAYIANYFANKQTKQQLKESGIKSGLTESSLLQGNANFENAYNQNELERIAAMRNIDMQKAVTDADYSSQLASYIGNLLLQEAQMGQSENAAANEYYMNQLAMAIDQANADRQYALQMQQLEYDRQQDDYNKTLQEIEIAYQLGDLERLKALGYNTDAVAAEIEARIREANGTGTGKGTGGSGTSGSGTGSSGTGTGLAKNNDGYIKNNVQVIRNGDGDQIQVMYVNGRAYNIDAVKKMISNGKAYITNDGTVKLVSNAG